jgi:hypothetical protein
LIVDTAADIPFDMYKDFGIELPLCLIEECDSDALLPFQCEVECVLMDDKRRLTCPITHLSAHYAVSHPTFPNISILPAISREQHTFTWDATLELPIYYSGLPLDSVISFRFLARLFQAAPKQIGFTQVRLRMDPFTLTFEGLTETQLQKHIRALATGKTPLYDVIDDRRR